jgi:hypothetical protein
MLVFALALGAQIQAQAKSAEPRVEPRLEKELTLNDVYMSPYETTTTMAAPKPTYFMSGSLMKFEPVFGLTMSTYTGASGNYSFSQKTGYLAGVGILVGRGNLQFETGVLYAERGGKETFLMGPRSWDIEYKNRFIEVPLMARYNFETSKETRIYFKAGAVVGVLQDSTGNVSNAQNMEGAYPAAYGYNSYNPYNGAYYTAGGTAVNDGNTKQYFGSTEMRWAAGLGGVVRITRNIAWTMDADYQNSISKVSDTQPNGYYGTTSYTLKAITYGLNTGLLFSL